MTQTICGYPNCDCERDPPPDPAYCAKRLPTREPAVPVAELKFLGVPMHVSLVRELAGLLAREAALLAQLPEGMKHCTIVFKECGKGHGWLTAANWEQHGCPTCERDALLAREAQMREALAAAEAEIAALKLDVKWLSGGGKRGRRSADATAYPIAAEPAHPGARAEAQPVEAHEDGAKQLPTREAVAWPPMLTEKELLGIVDQLIRDVAFNRGAAVSIAMAVGAAVEAELRSRFAAALASEREAGRREATGGCVECGGPLQWRCPSCRICQSPAVADQPAAALASEREAGTLAEGSSGE